MPSQQKQIGILLSGGLDSAALASYFLKKNIRVWPIYVRCGLRWEKTELYWAKKFLNTIKAPRVESLAILSLNLEGAYQKNWSKRNKTPSSKSADEAVYLPGRNLLLIIKSALHLYSENVSTIALATLKGNPFPDARNTYFKRLANVLKESFNRPFQIKTPFSKYSKKHVIQKFGDYPIHYSFSCINPKGHFHCGKCNKCAERKKAFQAAKVKDRTFYAA